MKWNPILQDISIIHRNLQMIYSCIQRISFDKNNAGLMGGKTGVVVFLFYYSKLVDKQEPYDSALELLTSVFEDINNGYNFHTHAGGLAGIGTVVEILTQEDFIDADTNELLVGLDEYLYKLMLEIYKYSKHRGI